MFGKKLSIICIQFSRELECWKHVLFLLKYNCKHSASESITAELLLCVCKAEVSKFSCLHLFVGLGLCPFGVWAELEGSGEPTTKPLGQLWFHLALGVGQRSPVLLPCSCCRYWCGDLTCSEWAAAPGASSQIWPRTLGDG